MADERRWTVKDRDGNEVYLTDERWQHITDPLNHPEMLNYEEELKKTIRAGRRKQDALNPQKHKFSLRCARLVADNTHIVAVALHRFRQKEDGSVLPNNYVVTAYQKEMK